MKSPKKLLTILAVMLSFAGAVGCSRTISKSEKSSVSSDGTVKTKETTVSEKPDGSTVKTQETKKTTPDNP